MVVRVVCVDYLCNIRYLVSMEDDSIQCRACNGEGIDLDGFVCWKCKERAKLLISVHQKTQLTLTSINLHAKTIPINIL
jgi:hypothetical protein